MAQRSIQRYPTSFLVMEAVTQIELRIFSLLNYQSAGEKQQKKPPTNRNASIKQQTEKHPSNTPSLLINNTVPHHPCPLRSRAPGIPPIPPRKRRIHLDLPCQLLLLFPRVQALNLLHRLCLNAETHVLHQGLGARAGWGRAVGREWRMEALMVGEVGVIGEIGG